MRVFLALLFSFAMVCLPGCGGPTSGLPVYTGGSELPPTDPAYPTEVQVKYLGAGGVVIKRGADVLLTAPFFSNPSIPRVAFGEIKSLPEQVDRFLNKPDAGIAGATAILVGHAHYDHLMDVPYIKKKFLPQVKIYGSDTMKNTLAGDSSLSGGDVISVEQGAGTATQQGKWVPAGPRIRIMALKSEHAPIIFHIKFFEGNYDQPLKEIPTRASGWLEGQTLAYLIDFLSADGKTVEFRIHYQDAASTAPLGFPPMFDQPQDQRPVDLALVCVPGFNEVENYPEALVARLKPKFVVMIHWENFFALLPDDPRDLRTVPTEKPERFIARLEAATPKVKYTLPAPGAWMRFAP
jgi:L-ascorbate metabolism protein UlaG (beta-lactamase superfamily)